MFMTCFAITKMEPLSTRMLYLHLNILTCRYRPLYIGTINPLWRVSEDQELTMKVKDVGDIEPTSSPVFAASGGAVNGGYIAAADEYDAGWSSQHGEKSAYWMSQVCYE